MRAAFFALLLVSSCSFLTDDDPYRGALDGGGYLDAALDARALPRVCEANADCSGATPFCSSSGQCVACQPHRFCGGDTKSLCIDDGKTASCQPLLDPSTAKACDTTFPHDLSALKNNDIFHIGMITRLPSGISKSAYGQPSAQAVEVAVNEINNDNSGLPVPMGNTRKLVVIECNEDALSQADADARSAGNFSDLGATVDHLVKTLRVPVIIGGSTSSVTTRVNADFLQADTLLVSPSATDDTITDAWRPDKNNKPRQLFWRTVAPDSRQVPALKAVLGDVQDALRHGDAGTPSVGSTYDSTNSATRNLPTLFATQDPQLNLNSIAYTPRDATNNADVIRQLVSRANGIIVPLGIGEFVTYDANGKTVSMLAQLEAQWQGRKPWYVMSEGSRTNFGAALAAVPGLVERVIGTAPGARQEPLYQTFVNNFNRLYPGEPGNLAESGYDAAYLIAYATVLATASGATWPSGTDLGNALEKLSCKASGTQTSVPVPAGTSAFSVARQAILNNPTGCFDFQGASGPLDYVDSPLSTLTPKSKEPSADMSLWCLGDPTNERDQTTTIKTHYFQQASRQITPIGGNAPLNLAQANWCKTASAR
jgi:ABC-type branched-subunit amino acid transport system substrate-binding protein